MYAISFVSYSARSSSIALSIFAIIIAVFIFDLRTLPRCAPSPLNTSYCSSFSSSSSDTALSICLFISMYSSISIRVLCSTCCLRICLSASSAVCTTFFTKVSSFFSFSCSIFATPSFLYYPFVVFFFGGLYCCRFGRFTIGIPRLLRSLFDIRLFSS